MSQELSFADLIRRVRAQDQEAATELVKRYESTIRRAVRFRLVDTRLGAMLDSMDICQSVLASFFARATSGEYELDKPEQLLKLLVAMARNKLASAARKQGADRRDFRRTKAAHPNRDNWVAPEASPSQQVAAEELLQEAQRRLTPDEQQLVEMRRQGRDWADIAAELGSSPVLLRKKLSRARERVTQQLGLSEYTHA
jgi:RNA polymerase sigma factor (sigma-70 family)